MRPLLTILFLFAIATAFAEDVSGNPPEAAVIVGESALAERQRLCSEARALEELAETQKKGERITTLASAFALRQKAKKIKVDLFLAKDEAADAETTTTMTLRDVEKADRESLEEYHKRHGEMVMRLAKSIDLTPRAVPPEQKDPRQSERDEWETRRRLESHRKALRDRLEAKSIPNDVEQPLRRYLLTVGDLAVFHRKHGMPLNAEEARAIASMDEDERAAKAEKDAETAKRAAEQKAIEEKSLAEFRQLEKRSAENARKAEQAARSAQNGRPMAPLPPR